jgi:hypothetical protein
LGTYLFSGINKAMSKFDSIFEQAMVYLSEQEKIATAKNTSIYPHVLRLVSVLSGPTRKFLVIPKSGNKADNNEKIAADICNSDDLTFDVGTRFNNQAAVTITIAAPESDETTDEFVVKVSPVDKTKLKNVKEETIGTNAPAEEVPEQVADYIEKVQMAATAPDMAVQETPPITQPGAEGSALPGVENTPINPNTQA